MNYSRRQLYAMGEPLGENVTRKKAGGGMIFGGGDNGGGSSAPATQTQISDLPDWAKPYAQKALAQGEALTDINNNPYQTYNAPRIAQFTQMQKDAFAGADSMTTSPQLGQASGYANTAIQNALGMSYNPYQAANQYQGPGAYSALQFGNQFQAPGAYNPLQTANQYQGFDPYQAGSFQNRFQAPGAYQTGQFSVDRVGLPSALQTYQMGPAQQVYSDRFDSGDASRYMSPYIQQAINPQLREATRASEVQRNMDQATAVSKGAYGGSRQAIVEAERERNLGTLQNDIVNKGYQTAYEQAANMYNQDQARSMQAQTANQQAGLTVGQQNLAAALGVQQLGTQSGLQAALANQQYGLQAQQLAEQSRQFGAGQGLTAAQLQAQYGLSADQAEEASRQFASNQAANQAAQQAQYGQQAQQLYEQSRQFGAGQGLTAAQLQAQYGLSAQQAQEAANQFGANYLANQAANYAQYGQAAQQLAEQSRQYGSGLSLQGLQAALSGAGQLGQLGQTQFGQQMDLNKLLYQYGGAQQNLTQQSYNTAYQDFLNQQRYPYQQLEFMSSLIRGTPTGTVSTMYGYQPTQMQNLASLGMGAYGISQMMPRAEGGPVYSYAEGGVTSQGNVESILDRLSDEQLQQAKQVALAERDAERAQMIDAEIAQRASIRGGLGGAFNALPEDQQQNMLTAAGGGIVAFAGDEEDNDPETGQLVAMGPGNPGMQQQFSDRLMKVIDRMEASKGYTPLTAAERRTAEKAAYDDLTRFAGGENHYDSLRQRLETQDADRADALRQGRGLAALQAASAMVEKPGFFRGLGAAGAAFGDSYSKALRADDAEKRYIGQMQFNLADAQRKERLGLTKEARADVQSAETARYNAAKSGNERDKNIATALGRGIQATRAGAGAGGAKQVKLNEQLAAAEIAVRDNPTEENLRRVEALRSAVAQTRTSDIGPNRTSVAQDTVDARVGAEISKEQSKVRITPEYMEAKPDVQAKMLREAAKRGRENANRAEGGGPRTSVNDNSSSRAPTRLKFDEQGNPIP